MAWFERRSEEAALERVLGDGDSGARCARAAGCAADAFRL